MTARTKDKRNRAGSYAFQGPITANVMAVGDHAVAQSFGAERDLILQADKAVRALKLAREDEKSVRGMLNQLSASNLKSEENKSVFRRIVATLKESGSLLSTASSLLQPIKLLGQAIGVPIPW